MSEQAKLILKIMEYVGQFASEIEYHEYESKIPEAEIDIVIEWLTKLKKLS